MDDITIYDRLSRDDLLLLLKQKQHRLEVLEGILKEVQQFRMDWITKPGGLHAIRDLFIVLDYQDNPSPGNSADFVMDALDPVDEEDDEDLT